MILGTTALTETTTVATRVSVWTALALTEAGGMGELADLTVTTTAANYTVAVSGVVQLPPGDRSGMRLFVTVGGTKQTSPIAIVEPNTDGTVTGFVPITGRQIITAAAGSKVLGLVAEYLGAAKLRAPLTLTVEEASEADYRAGVRADLINLFSSGTVPYHTGSTTAVATADATNEATAIAMANALRTAIVAHFADDVAHVTASAETIAAAVATDLTETHTLLNELKADFNDHLDEAGVHLANDAATVATADSSDEATAIALGNALKAAFNIHVASKMSLPVA